MLCRSVCTISSLLVFVLYIDQGKDTFLAVEPQEFNHGFVLLINVVPQDRQW